MGCGEMGEIHKQLFHAVSRDPLKDISVLDEVDFVMKDGQVYKRNQQGNWSEVDRSGQWKGVKDPVRTQDLSRQYQGRSYGQQRYQGYRSSMSRGGGYRRGGGRRH